MNDQSNANPTPSFDAVVAFHGHACPGLALGYRVAIAAMARLCANRSEDEDLVAVVENDACSVDAVQFVCGCTFGKGNLIFRDHGKQAYTFFNRTSGQGLRLYIEPPEREASNQNVAAQPDPGEERRRRIDWLLSLPETELLRITKVQTPPPSKARIHSSARCAECGERMMETRAVTVRGKTLCLSCAGSGDAIFNKLTACSH